MNSDLYCTFYLGNPSVSLSSPFDRGKEVAGLTKLECSTSGASLVKTYEGTDEKSYEFRTTDKHGQPIQYFTVGFTSQVYDTNTCSHISHKMVDPAGGICGRGA